MIRDRELLKLRFTATSQKDEVEIESFCKFIGIVRIDLHMQSNDFQTDLLKKVNDLTELVLQMADKINMDLSEMGFLSTNKLVELASIKDLKEILQKRFPEDMVIFDDLLKIFQKYNMSSLISATDMLWQLYPWNTDRYSNFYPSKEEKQMAISISDKLELIVPELEELKKSNPNNPFVRYAWIFCQKECSFMCQISDQIPYYFYKKMVPRAEKLLREEPFFTTAKLLMQGIQYDGKEHLRGYNMDYCQMLCDWEEIKTFFNESKDFWYKFIKMKKLSIPDRTSILAKMGDYIAADYYNIFSNHIERTKKAYNEDSYSYQSVALRIMGETSEELYEKVIKPAEMERHTCWTDITVIRAYKNLSKWSWQNDEFKKKLYDSRKAYMDKVREDYVWMFGEYWEVLHNLFLLH